MKWTIIVLVAGLVAVGANLEEDHKEEASSLPVLRIKQLGEDAAIVPAPEKESQSSEETALAVSSSPETNSSVEEENSDNETKRVKKSHGLTTICVEIKPTSPYEPPYFMCRGTDNEHGSYGGGYKPSSYGGKPYSDKGGPYGYEKPPHGGYASHEDYHAPASGGYGKPKPEKYIIHANAHGGHEKPGHGGSGGTYGGINAYGRPIKYQTPHSSAPSVYKPSAPYGSGYEGPHAPAGYGKPGGHYEPAPQHGVQYLKPYGGEGYHAGPPYQPPAHGPSAYGPASHAGHGPGYSSGGSYPHGPPYKGGSKPAGYDYAKPADKYHGASKGSGGYSAPQTGYRTIIMDGDDDDDDEINEFEAVQMAPQLGMPMPYNAQPAYPMPAPQVHSYSSPAPKVPCGTNLLVGCSPSVQPVPCYGSPAAQPPSIVYNIQPAPPMYTPPAPPPPPAYRPAPPTYKPAPPTYKPAPPAYPQQKTPTEEMSPKMEDQQKDTQQIQNPQSRTQTDTVAKTNDAELRFQQGNIETAPQQAMNAMNDDKMRQSTDGSQGPMDSKPPTSNQFKHPGVLRQMDDNAGKMAAEEAAKDMKMSDGDDSERAKIDAMMRMTQMAQMKQMEQMAMGGPRMADGASAKMSYY